MQKVLTAAALDERRSTNHGIENVHEKAMIDLDASAATLSIGKKQLLTLA